MASRAVDTLRIVPTPEVRFAWQGGTTGRALPLRPMARRRRVHRRWRAWAGWAVVGALVVGSQWVLGGQLAHAQESEDTAAVVDVSEAEDAPVEIGTALQVARVRVTYYLERGATYSGAYTRPGVAACSWDLSIGTRLRFPDGREVVCLDRGRLGSGVPYSWVDIFASSPAEGRRMAAIYGSVTVVEVVL